MSEICTVLLIPVFVYNNETTNNRTDKIYVL